MLGAFAFGFATLPLGGGEAWAQFTAPLHAGITIDIGNQYSREADGDLCFQVSWSYTAPSGWETVGKIRSGVLRRYPKPAEGESPGTKTELGQHSSEHGQTGSVTLTAPAVEDCPTPGVTYIYEVEGTFNFVFPNYEFDAPATREGKLEPSPPQPPDIVSAELGLYRNHISWSRVLDGDGLFISGYRIWHANRPDAADVDWILLHTVRSPWTTSYVHNTRQDQQLQHYYYLVTVASTGDSIRSTVVGGPVLTAVDLLDMNGVDELDSNDLEIMYFAYGFRDLLGRGSDSNKGFGALRQAILGGLSGTTVQPGTQPTDEQLRAFLSKADDLLRTIDALEFDVNSSGAVTQDDALILHYAHTMVTELGDGQTGGTEDFRRTFLGPLAVSRDPSDADLRRLLERANTLLGN